MKTCKNDDSTLSATVAEGSYVQDSKGAWDAGRTRSLRHASNVGRSIYGARRFNLSPALFAIIFGILSMLLFPSTGRSQTVEELQQQIARIQSQIANLQSDITGDEGEIAALEAEKENLQAQNDAYAQELTELSDKIIWLAGKIGQCNSEMSASVLAAQGAERAQLAADLKYYAAEKAALEAQLQNLDPESETYQSDYDSISSALQSNNNDTEAANGKLDELDQKYELAKPNDAFLQALIDFFNGQALPLLQQIAGIQSNIDSNNARIQDIDSLIGTLQGVINDLQSQIDNLQNQINDLQSQIDALNNM